MRRLTAEEFIRRAQAVHGTQYDYSQARYVDATVPVTIICRKHGSFQQLPSNHMRGAGCARCTKSENRRKTTAKFIEAAQQVHGQRFDYSQTVYQTNRQKVTIVCPIHGPFLQSPNKHLLGRGCPLCATNHKDDTTSFIRKARAVHGNIYDYSKVQYVDTGTKVCIIDPEYGEFWQTSNAHLNGKGCWQRRAEKNWETRRQKGLIPVSEQRVYNMLTTKFGVDDVRCEYWSERYPFPCDFYVVSLDLYIELNCCSQHGGHWFDATSDEDVQRLKFLQDKAVHSDWYRACLRVWTQQDVAKLYAAKHNQLNYLVFWNNDLSDFQAWYDTFDATHILTNV